MSIVRSRGAAPGSRPDVHPPVRLALNTARADDLDGDEYVAVGKALLAEADAELFDDHLDEACRRYLLAAWCFAQAEHSSSDPQIRREQHIAYWYAMQAAGASSPIGL